jgi:hypothetical protein
MNRGRRLRGGKRHERNNEGTRRHCRGTAKSDPPANCVHRHPAPKSTVFGSLFGSLLEGKQS